MNLRAIANGITQAVNPNMTATLVLQGGYETDRTGRRIAKPEQSMSVTIQTQALTSQERQELEGGLLQQGQFLNVYITGQLHVLRRIEGKGAEKLIFAAYGESESRAWLIKSVTESWADWCKVLIWKQN